MKPDTLFPPPPQFGQPPLRCDDLTPARARAIERLGRIAEEAERCVGMDLESAPFGGQGLSFVQHCARGSRFVAELVDLLARGARVPKSAADEIPGIMLFGARAFWGCIGPMRGDVVVFADGQASIVVKPLCMGCQHFEAVIFRADPPAIIKLTQWHSAVKWIVRVVDEAPEAEPLTAAEGSGAALTVADGGLADSNAADEERISLADSPAPVQAPKRAPRRTGVR